MYRHLAPPLALSFAISCSGPQPEVVGPATSASAAPVPSVSAELPIGSASAAPSGSAVAAAPPAGWLDLAYDAKKTLPLRATIIEQGSVYPDETGLPINSPAASKTSLTTFVLEEPKADATRIRLLCETPGYRAALYFDRKDLAKTARRGALLVPQAADLARPPLPFTGPGLFFSAGAPLDPAGAPIDGVSKVHVKADHLEVDGFVSSKMISDVFEGEGAAPPVAVNAELARGAEFLDAPNGKRFAKLAPYVGTAEKHAVEKTTKSEKGFTVVRSPTSAGTLVGWVKSSNISDSGTAADKGVLAGAAAAYTRTIHVATGSKLIHHDTDVVVGIVRNEVNLTCRNNCDGVGIPIVLIDVCGAKVEVVAKPPPPPKPNP